MSSRRRQGQQAYPFVILAISVLVAVVSLGTVFRAYAMPVEARTTESWYSYKSSVGFDYTATVRKGRFYLDSSLSPGQLARVKLPIEPAVYHRVLISKLVDRVDVKVPYSFRADRPAPITAQVRFDATLSLPGVWERPYPLMDPKEIKVTGTEVTGAETFVVPVGQLIADLEAGRNEIGMNVEPLELRIRPVLEVRVEGLRQPVTVSNNPEFVISMRSTTVELDEPREARAEKELSETRVVSAIMPIFGISVVTMRLISLVSLAVSLVLATLLVWRKRRKPDARVQLQKLGSSLISVRSFELPPGTAVADVRSVRELLQLHVQTERPVIQVGKHCYLLDGTTCYRFSLVDEEDSVHV